MDACVTCKMPPFWALSSLHSPAIGLIEGLGVLAGHNEVNHKSSMLWTGTIVPAMCILLSFRIMGANFDLG